MTRGQALLLALIIVVVVVIASTEAFAPHGVVHDVFSQRTKRTSFGITTSFTRSSLSSSTQEEEEWHPIDMAYTTPQLLSALWFMIAQGSGMVKGESSTLIFPQMQDKFSPSYLNCLMGHLDSCKDVCDSFGTKTVLYPYKDKRGKMTGFTVKSYHNPDATEEEFPYDPFWDDGDDWNYEGIDEEIEGKAYYSEDYPEIVNKVPDDDEVIIGTTKVWVDKMMSDMGICPFTSGPNMAGLPMGPVFYAINDVRK
jgi:hypothetical protein